MGIRPEKYIGWGVEVSRHQINEERLEEILEAKHTSNPVPEYNYASFYDFIKDHSVREWFDQMNPYSQKLEQYRLLDYVDFVESRVDGVENDSLYVILYPMAFMPYAFPEGADPLEDFKQRDNPFIISELEHFFPESLKTFLPCSYTFNTPVFPSDYSVIQQSEKTFENFTVYRDFNYRQDIYTSLRRALDGDDKKAEVFAKFSGFDSPEALQRKYRLAPPEDIFLLAQFLGILPDESTAYDLQPMTVYSWT